VVGLYEIMVGDIYNYDEMGICLGIGKKEKVITASKAFRITAAKDTSRESATVAEVISGDGVVGPQLSILASKTIQKRWCKQRDELPGNYLLAVSDTAYINDQLLLEWATHFKKWSKKRQISKNQLLILNGHTSHFTRQFIQFCDDYLIILFTIIPYIMYICQPLDVVVFQPYKHCYGQAVSRAFRNGCIDFNMMEFLQALHKVRLDTFKRSTVLSAWAKSGLIPFNPAIVLNQIQMPSPQATTPVDTGSIDNHPPETPACARTLAVLADPLDQEKDEDTWYILHEKFIRGSLAIAVAAEAAHRDLLRTTAAAQKRKDMQKNARRSLQTGGVLYVQDGRNAVENSELLVLQDA